MLGYLHKYMTEESNERYFSSKPPSRTPLVPNLALSLLAGARRRRRLLGAQPKQAAPGGPLPAAPHEAPGAGGHRRAVPLVLPDRKWQEPKRCRLADAGRTGGDGW